MFNLMSPKFIFFFIYSFIALFISAYIPGSVVLKYSKLKAPFIIYIALSISVGISFWALQGFILGFLNLRFLTYIYLLVFSIFWLKNFRFQSIKFKFNKFIIMSLLLITAGVLSQNIASFFMGIQTSHGISFCCVDASDSLYFASLSQEIVNHIPPFEPGLSGTIVKNYHYLSNIFIAEISRVFLIPLNILQFQVSSLFLSILLGLSALSFGLYVVKREKFTLWILFFLYFGGDLIWLFLLFLNKGVNPFVMSSLEDGVKFLSNPPRAFAIIQFFNGTALLYYFLKEKRSLFVTTIVGIVFGTLIGFKVYIGIFAISGLFVLCIYQLFKRNIETLKLLIVSGVVSLLLYLPVNSNAGGLYFTGFWSFENFISQPYLNLGRLELSRRIFLDDNKILKSYFFEAIFFITTIFSFFGTKIIGVFQTKKSLSQIPLQIHIFLLTGLLLSFVLGFFFQQASGGSNTFNFIVSVFIIGSIYTALSMDYVTSFKKPITFLTTIVIISLTVPRVIYETTHNIQRLTSNLYQSITPKQLEAFEYLRSQDKGLTIIDRNFFGLDSSSPYVSFFVNQPMYLSGAQILESHGVKVSSRNQRVLRMLDPLNIDSSQKLYKEEGIKYLVIGKTSPIATVSATFSKTLFSNNEVVILKIEWP